MKFVFMSTLESEPWGGSEQLWTDAALFLLEQGHQVLTNTMEWDKAPEKLTQLNEKGAMLTFRPNPHVHGKLTDIPANKLKGYKWKARVAEFEPDVIFVSEGGTFDNALLQQGNWLLSFNKPVYVLAQFKSEYEYMQESSREFFIDFMSKCEKVLFVSERNKERSEIVLASKIENAVVVKNPLRIKESVSQYPPEDVYNIGVVARMDTLIKGYDILAGVFAQPQWTNRNYKVNIYGSGLQENYIRELVAFYGLESKLIFRGFERNIQKIWSENHLMLMTSRGEGTPLSLIEANYCRRAAVVTDVGGNADVITEGYNGFVAEAAVVCSVSAAMERAWKSRDSWKEMGIAAKEHIDMLYATDAVADIVNMILEREAVLA